MRLSYGAFATSVNGEPTRVSHSFVKKNKIRYMRPHGRFAHLRTTSAYRSRPWIYAAFLHSQCANRPFRPLVSKYTILRKLIHFIAQYSYEKKSNGKHLILYFFAIKFWKFAKKNAVLLVVKLPRAVYRKTD